MRDNGWNGRSAFKRLATASFVALALLCAPGAAAEAEPLADAQREGVHLVMRHAIAPGTGDPASFRIGDCATQRVLSDEGREQARAIGERLRKAGVRIDVVLTSQWCRCRETAELMDVGPVEDAPFLNSFFRNRDKADAQRQAAVARLRELTAQGRKALFVTHQVNVTGLTGVYPSSGEIVLVAIGEDGGIETHGSIGE
ncbi:histidine phosphatase family protein [Fulvimarina sp. 2208YS6-2-32]|uniref:Histidine phosphatase family protein n=1 Tax=Fulvimarina uroteuthidis TaxID=3098149 RepID=A0ABU5I4W0_9HYPH|nr:histidine phosphatase family protein [Fulvimarina sp. 2208YS6-2-32]MDY8110431.1 histidine phosphatase family protein [Fulvimarina sp. 2208YS6-2-32]